MNKAEPIQNDLNWVLMDLLMIFSSVISAFCVYAAWGSWIAGIYPELCWGLFFGIARWRGPANLSSLVVTTTAVSGTVFVLFWLAFNSWGLDLLLPVAFALSYLGLGLLALLLSFRSDFFPSELGIAYWLLPLGCALVVIPYLGLLLLIVIYQLFLSRTLLRAFT